jgi:hypothetical protein
MRYLLLLCLATVPAGCGTFLTESLKPPPARAIDYTVDVQPVLVFAGWDMDRWAQLTDQLGPAFAQAGVAFRILDPVVVQNPAWERVDNEDELREMMNGAFDGVRVWLVEDLAPETIGTTGALALTTGVAGATFPPTSDNHGIALSIGAYQDDNTLAHEMGHALGLDHPSLGANACLVPQVAVQFMSYCYTTRDQFTPEQIQTIRKWAAVYAH